MNLKRYPVRENDLLQAWDSADELLLKQIESLELAGKRILVMNDSFGAISLGVKKRFEASDLTVYTDSYLGSEGIRLNSGDKIHAIHALGELSGVYDFVFYRIPKNMSFFEDQLCRLSQHLKTDSGVVGTAMVKHLAKSAFDLLERIVGKTHTSLAEKKARLVFAKVEKVPQLSVYPKLVQMDGFKEPFTQTSNLFSREKLDIGSRFFLEHLPKGNFDQILDLGCANGIIGIKAKLLNPQSKIVFTDESAMAVESARANYAKYFTDEAEFHFTNGFEKQTSGTIELVLCNPPFHQGQTIGDHIAHQMFKDAFHALKRDGAIRVVGNSHLPYPQKLKSIFGNSRIVATHPKFVIIESVKKA